jgi:hypothetical protein
LFGEGDVSTRAGNLRELPEHIIQEKSQPDAFAFSLCAHHIHAVVPVSGAKNENYYQKRYPFTANGRNLKNEI